MAVGAFLLLPLRAATVGFGSRVWSICYHAVLAATVLAMAVTGHLGGNLTHGSDYLVKHMPPGLRSTLTVLPKPVREFLDLPDALAAPAPGGATIYTALLGPAFDKHCVSCHNDKKTKGGLRMDSMAAILKGGDTGPGISLGKPNESEVIHRITLPADDDDFMPPDGKPALSKEEVAAIRWWVESGQPAETLITAITDAPVEVKSFLDRAAKELTASAGPGPAEPAAAPQAGLPAEAIDKINSSGPGRVQPVSRDPKDGLILVNAGSGPAFNDEALARIAPVAPLLREIDLSRTGITDQGLALVAKCPDLRKLRLDQTKIGSSGVASLLALGNLETLNLFGTAVDDTAIDHLAQLKALKAVYLGETKVTPDGLKKLQAALPDCKVLGSEAPPVAPAPTPPPKA